MMTENQEALPKIWYDEHNETIYIGDEKVDDLSKMQQTILQFLIQNPLVRHDQYVLMNLVWPDPHTHKESTPNALQAHIFQIRKRIEPDPAPKHARYLITWYGSPGGYQFFPEGRPEVPALTVSPTFEGLPEKVWIEEQTQNLYQGETLLQGLSDRQFTLLRYFVENPYVKHTREKLIEVGWTDKEQQKGVNINALQAHIVYIRKRIEPDFSHPRFLVTWHGRATTGYQFWPEGIAKLPRQGLTGQDIPAENILWYDEVTQNLYQGQSLIQGLSERQSLLLRHLIQNPYIEHSRHILMKEAWSEIERNEGVTPNALQVHIYQIRKHIEPNLEIPRYLLTWKGKPGGYYCVPEGQKQHAAASANGHRERQGEIWFDEASQGIFQGQTLIESLSKKGYALLKFLIENPREKLPQAALIEYLEADKKPKDIAVKALYRHVEQVRKQIEPDLRRPKYLLTWHSRPGGYQFFPDGNPDEEAQSA